jgi:ubiquinone/menaquinone biosynthesis C-methylase UbiE
MSRYHKTTKDTYEDPEVVEAYIKRHTTTHPDSIDTLDDFAHHIVGKKLLDLGCGPGIDSYEFAKRGFEVTGIDYSEEMIKKAKELRKQDYVPEFIVGDMYQLDRLFHENEFDAVWANKSLLHIPEDSIQDVLLQIYKITKPQGMVFVSLKEGVQGTRTVKEENYSKEIEREFTFWEEENFIRVCEDAGYAIHSVENFVNFKNVTWLQFVLQVIK